MISELIDKQDSFEIIRDQIAALLSLEVANQMALATTAGRDPEQWNLEIYSERANPWEKFLNQNTDKTPIINVWFDNSSFNPGAGSTVERQKTEGVFNIDCYGFGVSADDGGTGHIPGDKDAALEVQRSLRLVRNILMAGTYTYLNLRGLVWQRWPQAITMFQPEINGQYVQNVIACRLALRVIYNEFSPQVPFETLELLTNDIQRTEDGQIIAEVDFEYPLI